MNPLDSVPIWLAVPIAILVVVGSTLPLIGAYGFVRLRNFYDRLHAPALGTSWGSFAIVLASIMLASYLQNRPIIHEIVVGLGMLVTVPVVLMLLGRAALHRDRQESADRPALFTVGPDGRIVRSEDVADVPEVSSHLPGDDVSEPAADGASDDGNDPDRKA